MYSECRHVFINGKKCGSPALHNDSFCFYHTNARRRPKPHTEAEVREDSPLQLPTLDDPDAIQLAISDVVLALAAGTLDPRRARSLLYGLQIASQHYRAVAALRAKELERSRETKEEKTAPPAVLEIVREIFPQPDGTALGPQKESPDPEDIPLRPEEMTFGRMLLMQAIELGKVDPAQVQICTEQWIAFKQWLNERQKQKPSATKPEPEAEQEEAEQEEAEQEQTDEIEEAEEEQESEAADAEQGQAAVLPSLHATCVGSRLYQQQGVPSLRKKCRPSRSAAKPEGCEALRRTQSENSPEYPLLSQSERREQANPQPVGDTGCLGQSSPCAPRPK